MSIKCPFCDSVMTLSDANNSLHCPTHKIFYYFDSFSVDLTEDTPEYVKESVYLLDQIAKGKVWVAYGKHDIFSEEFSLDKTTIVNGNIDLDKLPSPTKEDVLISYNNKVSRYLKQEMISALKIADDKGLGKKPNFNVTNAASQLFAELGLHSMDKDLTAEQDRALIAYISPTAQGAVDALLWKNKKSFSELSNSEVLMYAVLGDKDALVSSFSTEAILKSVHCGLVESARFCDTSQLQKLRKNNKYAKITQHLSFIQATELYDSTFSPERLLLKGNDWSFWIHDLMFNCIDFTDYVNDTETMSIYVSVAAFLHKLFKTWGDNHTKLDPDILNQAEGYVGFNDTTKLYMTYWNILSEKLEKLTV